jgi:hypothetical protein
MPYCTGKSLVVGYAYNSEAMHKQALSFGSAPASCYAYFSIIIEKSQAFDLCEHESRYQISTGVCVVFDTNATDMTESNSG